MYSLRIDINGKSNGAIPVPPPSISNGPRSAFATFRSCRGYESLTCKAFVSFSPSVYETTYKISEHNIGIPLMSGNRPAGSLFHRKTERHGADGVVGTYGRR
jgi:hypothetical protein